MVTSAYLTIIPQTQVEYKLIYSVKRRAGSNLILTNKRSQKNFNYELSLIDWESLFLNEKNNPNKLFSIFYKKLN